MLQTIFGWLAKSALDWLAKFIAAEVVQWKKEHERDVTNEENKKKYDEATDRADRVKKATDLINGTHST